MNLLLCLSLCAVDEKEDVAKVEHIVSWIARELHDRYGENFESRLYLRELSSLLPLSDKAVHAGLKLAILKADRLDEQVPDGFRGNFHRETEEVIVVLNRVLFDLPKTLRPRIDTPISFISLGSGLNRERAEPDSRFPIIDSSAGITIDWSCSHFGNPIEEFELFQSKFPRRKQPIL